MILKSFFEKDKVSPDYCTEAIRQEIRRKNQSGPNDNEIVIAERNLKFPEVEQEFRVIDSNTVTVVVDSELAEKIRRHEKVEKSDIQNNSVQIWHYKIHEIPGATEEIEGYSDIFEWKLRYDDFIGYMLGLLDVLEHNQRGLVI
jgi:hypothetical protein